jgi:DNA-binding response OmpR family regulator
MTVRPHAFRPTSNVLFVGLDAALRSALERRLSENEVRVVVEDDVDAAPAHGPDVDVAVVDVRHAGALDLARGLRRFRPKLPLLSIGAADDVATTVELLDRGVEDHLEAPADADVAAWRVQAATSGGVGVRPLGAQDLRFDEGARTVHYQGRSATLTPCEYDLDATLARKPGHVFRRGDVVARLWGRDSENGERAVDALVSRTRRRLERELGVEGGMIRTVRGVGYQFERRRTVREDDAEAVA